MPECGKSELRKAIEIVRHLAARGHGDDGELYGRLEDLVC